MSVRAGIAAIRAARKLVPVGDDPLVGPWQCLSTDGSYRHLLHWDPARETVTCSTCWTRHGRRQCWATAQVLQALGQAKQTTPEPEPGTWRAAFDEARRRRVKQPVTTPTGQQPLADHNQGEPR
jgi:hypothetical protein